MAHQGMLYIFLNKNIPNNNPTITASQASRNSNPTITASQALSTLSPSPTPSELSKSQR